MNNEEKILSLLENQGKVLEAHGKALEALIQGQAKLEEEVKDIKLDMVDVKQDINILKLDMVDVKQDINILKLDMADVKQDINILKLDMTDVKQEVTNVKISLENKTNKNILKLVDGFVMHSEKLKKVDEMSEDIVFLKMDTSNLKTATKELFKKVAL